MIFSVSKEAIQRSLDFGPDSVTLTVKDVVQEMTKNSQATRLAAWTFLLSQRKEFLDNHLALVPATLNQQKPNEMRDETFSSVGAQDMNKSRYQVSNPENVEIYWEIDQLDVDAVYRPGVITPFEQQRLTTWRWEVHQKKHSVRRTGGQEHSSNRNNL